MCKVSVVVPIYNGESHITQCCKMLCEQTLTDIQIILVDDGSKDNSWKYIEECSKKYSNIIAVHQENKGVSAARNAGLKHCTGEYIGFVDVDDQADSDMFEVLYNIAKENDFDIIGMEPLGKYSQLSIFEKQTDALKLLFTQKIRMAVWNKLFRASVVEKVEFPVGIRINEDFKYIYSAFLIAQKIGCINIEKYHYIQWEGSSSRTVLFEEKAFDAIEIADYVYADCLKRFPEISIEIEARKARTYIRIVKQYYMGGNPKECYDRIQKLRSYLKSLDRKLLGKYFGKYDLIRYVMYIYIFPLFVFFEKHFDRY